MLQQEPMMLEGKPVVEGIYAALRPRIQKLQEAGITPCLATILVGDDLASATYVRMKGNACHKLGMESRRIRLSENTTTEQLLDTIHSLNQDDKVHGILLQHPVPSQIDERAAFDAILPEKDVDGVSSLGFGRMAYSEPSYASCTPEAIISVIDHYNIPIAGRHAVVIGRSAILGKPVSFLLLNRDATVTVCHSKTQDLPKHVGQADIVVAAVGKPRFVQGEWLKHGAVVLDAGYNEGNVGDVDFDSALAKAAAITPVPGGIGPVTIATLLRHTVEAAELVVQG
jgi:methylenetetrahydrofolate dehydrogenase (NADP+) / methenyltetrahydrofolate cyclohydrolase